MIIKITQADDTVTTIDFEKEYTLIRERYENVTEEQEVEQSKEIRAVYFGTRWYCEVKRENSTGDTTFHDMLKNSLNKAKRVRVSGVRKDAGGEFDVIPFNLSWQYEGQFREKSQEDSWSFELKAVNMEETGPDPESVTITADSTTTTLYGVEVTERLEEERTEHVAVGGTMTDKVEWVVPVLTVRMGTSVNAIHLDNVLTVLKQRFNGASMVLKYSKGRFFTNANALTAHLTGYDVERVNYMGLITEEYELTFRGRPLTDDEIFEDR